MNDLASLGLKVRICSTNDENERRMELRLVAPNELVAWFQTTTRMSAGEQVVTMNVQVVHRDDLSDEQSSGIREWLHEQMRAAL